VELIFLLDIGGKTSVVQAPHRSFKSRTIDLKTKWITNSHSSFDHRIGSFFSKIKSKDVCSKRKSKCIHVIMIIVGLDEPESRLKVIS